MRARLRRHAQRLHGLVRGLQVVERPQSLLCQGLGGIVTGTVALCRCRTRAVLAGQELGRLAKRTIADVRRHRDRVAALAACAEAIIETLGRSDDERPIAARFADGTGAAQLRPAFREFDAEHFGRTLDADALLQFAKVDRMGHGVLLSLPERIVRGGSAAIVGLSPCGLAT